MIFALLAAFPAAGATEVPFDDPRGSFEADSAEVLHVEIAFSGSHRVPFAAADSFGGRGMMAAAESLGRPREDAGDPYVYEHHRLDERVHVVYRPDPVRIPVESNSVVIEQTNGLVVVDTGGTPLSGRRIAAKIGALDLDKPVRWIVTTHWHGDHNLGNSGLLESFPGARIVGTRATREAMLGEPMTYIESRAEDFLALAEPLDERIESGVSPVGEAYSEEELRYYRMWRSDLDAIAEASAELPVLAPDVVFEKRLVLHDEEAPVEILWLGRGNTEGDAVVWLPKQKIVATGDLVVHPVPYGFGSFPDEWAETLRRLAELDFERLVPGHGEVQTSRDYLQLLVETLDEVMERVEPLVAEGLDEEEILERVDLSDLRARFAGDRPWLDNRFRAWFEMPIVGRAVDRALAEEQALPAGDGR